MVAVLIGAMLLVAVTVSAQTDDAAALPVSGEAGPSTRPPLTGIPQIDYIWDPNLPRELNGYNLSTYPFLDRVPKREDMDFKCDGLHDGFYASVPLKCQVYHHCVSGTRYDFLCANFTAFDQKIFNCQFANEVDCENSPLFYDRNEALYKTTTTTTEAAPIRRRRPGGNRQRPRPRPVYYDDYYDYDYQYDDVPGNEGDEGDQQQNSAGDSGTNEEEGGSAAAGPRPNRRRPGSGSRKQSIFHNNRPPPRIRPPVPNGPDAPANTGTATPTTGNKKSKSMKTTTPSTAEKEEDYDEEVEEEEEEVPSSTTTTTTTTTTPRPKKKVTRRPRPRTTTSTTTASPAEYDYEEEEVEEAPTTTTTRRPSPRRSKTTAAPVSSTTTRQTTTTAAASDSEAREIEPPLPSKPNTALFERKTPIANILRRRTGQVSTTPQPSDDQENQEEEEEEPIVTRKPSTTTTTTSTTTEATTTVSKRTTKARPLRPNQLSTATNLKPKAVIVADEETLIDEGDEEDTLLSEASNRIPASRTRPQAESAADAESSVVDATTIRPARVRMPTGRTRPQSVLVVDEETHQVDHKEPKVRVPAGRVKPQSPLKPTEKDEIFIVHAEAPKKLPSAARQGPQAAAKIESVEEEVEDDEKSVRQERNFNQDEVEDESEFAESQQWSIISLLSRALPQRA